VGRHRGRERKSLSPGRDGLVIAGSGQGCSANRASKLAALGKVQTIQVAGHEAGVEGISGAHGIDDALDKGRRDVDNAVV